jgi:hypothetical protein
MRPATVALALTLAVALFAFPATPASAVTFDVNRTGDLSDAVLNGTCDVNVVVAGNQCTLRAAIEEANGTAALDNITFSISGGGVRTISPVSPLPTIVEPLEIDGSTQEGFSGVPLIVLDGTDTVNGDGLKFAGADGSVRGLVIKRFVGEGIEITNATVTVLGNYIGTNNAGTAAEGNSGQGVWVGTGSYGVSIGSGAAADRNIISGNDGNGILIEGAPRPLETLIAGNYIGTDASGTAAVPNQFTGILVAQAEDTVIGGLSASPGGPCDGQCNLISGNGETGIWVTGDVDGLDIVDNMIAYNVDGDAALPNVNDGVLVWSATASDITIGLAGYGNIIASRPAGGAAVGIRLGDGITVAGNYIGVGASGTLDLGGQFGIQVNGGTNILIGGTGEGDGNVVGGIEGNGLRLDTPGIEVYGNVVGMEPGGLGAPNGAGIRVDDGANPVIGGENPGEQNVIAFNEGDGISLNDANGATIGANAIFRNGVLLDDIGIDIQPDNGNDTNDAGDADSGPNGLQNYPVLTDVVRSTGNTHIEGDLNSTPGRTFDIRFFANSMCDTFSNGEGERYIGNVTTGATDGGGDVSFQVDLALEVVSGQWITATATDRTTGDTSEFSECFQAGTPNDCDGETAEIIGFDGKDYIIGTSGNDVILGFDGADEIWGEDGTDTICGQKGGDTIYGGLHDDVLIGATGDDIIFGGDNNDTIRGGDQVDEIHGDDGIDDLEGNDQADTLDGGPGDDDLKGGKGGDDLDGADNDDTCNGNTPDSGMVVDTAANCETVTNVP